MFWLELDVMFHRTYVEVVSNKCSRRISGVWVMMNRFNAIWYEAVCDLIVGYMSFKISSGALVLKTNVHNFSQIIDYCY